MQVSEYQPVAKWLLPWLQRYADNHLLSVQRFVKVSDSWPRPTSGAYTNQFVEIILRDDGATVTSPVTVEQDFALSIVAPTYLDADQCAARVTALLQTLPSEAATPVAAVKNINGPRPVPDDTYEHVRYITATAVCTGNITEITL